MSNLAAQSDDVLLEICSVQTPETSLALHDFIKGRTFVPWQLVVDQNEYFHLSVLLNIYRRAIEFCSTCHTAK